MPIVQDLGISLGYGSRKVWKLVSVDNPETRFVGQFPAENLVENVGARLPETNSVGQQHPVIQWQSGETETLNFRARIYRTSPVAGSAFDAFADPVGTAFGVLSGNAGPIVSNGSVRDQIELLKTMTRKNDDLGRQERFIFTYGTELEFEVFIRSIGGIAYDEIRSDGTIRGASFNINLVKLKPENQKEEAGVSLAGLIKTVGGVATAITSGGISSVTSSFRSKLIDIPGFSLHTIDKIVKAKQNDTFESIAASQYGNAQLGDILRRAQPDKADIKDGDEIVTIKKNEAVQLTITPQAVALRDKVENKLLLDEFLSLRGDPTALIV